MGIGHAMLHLNGRREQKIAAWLKMSKEGKRIVGGVQKDAESGI